ncbi:FIST C-terminal domain-containing protein [Oscillospiraceae bacterium OttesenSCG-928-F05]|nr:FIST C-terminal domain-containing protein [Oscillospiraceae bacterium OttesenSCG-928-F05]
MILLEYYRRTGYRCMIKSYCLHTAEADDAALAAADIMTQLEGVSLHKNSVGILACHYDFVKNGVVSALTAALPFSVVGITTFYQATEAASGLFELTITLLTSDNVRFSLGHDNAVDDLPFNRIKNAYERGRTLCGEEPKAIFSFLSLYRPISGDEFLRCLDEVSGGVPSFGAVTTGDDESGDNVYLICGDEVYTKGFALLLIAGDVTLDYYAASFLESHLLSMTGTVSRSEDTVVYELNGQPAGLFLTKQGIALEESEMDKVSTVPYLIRMPGDEALTARTLCGFNAEGALYFMGDVPEGSLFRFGTVSADDILNVSRAVTERAIEENSHAALLLMFSCVGRFITLGLESTAEMDHVKAVVPKGQPFLSCYAAGEICPVRKGGTYINRYHNSSFIVCALR